METDRIKVNLSRTINLGNYESIKIEVGLETAINDDAVDTFAAIGSVTDSLIESIVLQSKKFKRAVKPKKI